MCIYFTFANSSSFSFMSGIGLFKLSIFLSVLSAYLVWQTEPKILYLVEYHTWYEESGRLRSLQSLALVKTVSELKRVPPQNPNRSAAESVKPGISKGFLKISSLVFWMYIQVICLRFNADLPGKLSSLSVSATYNSAAPSYSTLTGITLKSFKN